MQNSKEPSQRKSWRRRRQVALTVVVVAALAATLQQGLLQDVLKDLRRYGSTAVQPPISDESGPAAFDLGDVDSILVSSELARPEFDPWTTPTVSGVDLDRLVHAAENLDPDRSCPQSEPSATGNDLVEILRFADGCLLIGYEELDGRSVEEVREQYEADTSILAIDRPALAFPLQSQGDPRASEQWHLEAVDAATLQSGWPDGAEVTVAVLDTGVDATHGDLDDNLVDPERDVHNLPGNYYGPSNGRQDSNGHGTHVAGIVAAESDNGIYGRGVAPLVSILPVTVIGSGADCTPSNDVLWVTEGIATVIGKDVDIINMSLFLVDARADCKKSDDFKANDPSRLLEDENAIGVQYSEDPNRTVEAVVRLAQMRGIVVVASAGNCGQTGGWWIFRKYNVTCREVDQRQYPAAFPGVVAVAATDRDEQHASFSTAADHVRIAAPGVDILSTVPLGSEYDTYDNDEDAMASLPGTSMAAPMVSAVLAHLIARYPNLGPDLIVQAMYATAENPNGEVWTKEFGHGLVRPLEAIRWLDNNVAIADEVESGDEQEIDYDEIEKTTGDTPVILIMDTSRSMGDTVDGQIKLEVAKASILEFLATTSPTRQVALRTYPAISGYECNPGELRIAPSPKTYEMEAIVQGLRADGGTPTAEALRAALGDILDSGFKQAEIVLVSDGESTCDPPCDVASEIAAAGVEVTVRTAGFRLSPEGDEELRCVAEATEGTHVVIEEGEELGEFYERNSKPDLEVELNLPDSALPSTEPYEEGQPAEAVIRNDSNVAAKNVIVAFEVGDGPEPERDLVSVGNIAAGATSSVSWSLRPGFSMIGSDIDLGLSATASNTEEVASTVGVVAVEDPNIAEDAGPILGVGEILLMGDQLLSGVGSSRQVSYGGCDRTGEVGLLAVFGQPSERSVACANAVLAHLVTPDWAKGVDSQINQFDELMDDSGVVNAVVLSIGATDFGLSELAQECVLSPVACDSEVSGVATEAWLGGSIAGDGPQRATALSELVRAMAVIDEQVNGDRERSRQAPILLLAQPRAFSFANGACFERWQGNDAPLLTQRELDLYHYFVSALNGTLEAAANAAQQLGFPVFFVDTTETAYLPDHTACSDESYVNSLEPLLEAGSGVASELAERGILAAVGEDLNEGAVAAFSERFLTPNRYGEQALANAVLNWSRTDVASEAHGMLDERFAQRTKGVAASIGSPARSATRVLGTNQLITSEPDHVWTATASGFLPGTLVTATVQPHNRVVASALADKTGTAALAVTLRPNTASGNITLIAKGLAPTGHTISIAQPIEVLSPLRPTTAITLPALAVVLYLSSLLVWRASRRRPNREVRRGSPSS